MKRIAIVGLAILGFLAESRAQWNMGYQRPAKYDYTSYYDAPLIAGLKGDTRFLSEALKDGWDFYKATFITQKSNYLVNHRRKVNGQVIGENEAVSEGQGYGMLLAVIMNDQATFNRVFEAANQYMWKDDRQSYFIWNWSANGQTSQGAATDGDIDIGMALVFADELVKKNLWQPYTKTPNYKTRAMEIIRSIRKNMTSQDYLLPGDNWGGDGLNHLNPSYFATANMKVFNAYQTEVSFTPVIASSYAVLKKCAAQYQKGQAPDWITKDGNKGPKGNDMLDDAIRTPYRIGLDAIWFGDPTAIEFCKNSRNSLTDYSKPESRYVMEQMGLYNANGTLVLNSSGLDRMAMWAVAARGSEDKAYATQVLRRDLILRMVGDGVTNGFGSTQLGEIDYYYKQSLALLGFAAITGQFANVLEDMKGDVKPLAIVSYPRNARPARSNLDAVTGWYRADGRAQGTFQGPAPVGSLQLIR